MINFSEHVPTFWRYNMYTFNVTFKNWQGQLVQGVMQICGQPDRSAAVACIRAELAINGYRLMMLY